MPGLHEAPNEDAQRLAIVQAQIDTVLELRIGEMTSSVRKMIESRLAEQAISEHLEQ